VSERVFFGVLTVFGVAMTIGRIFDAAADPLVAHASDHSRSRLGRRRSFLIYGAAPMVLLPAALFFPPGAPGSALNAAWLTALLSLYFVAFTVYVAPYLALLPELARTQDERVSLARALGVAAFPIVGLFGFGWTVGLDLGRAAGIEPEDALRGVVLLASLLAALLCLAPILAVDERRHASGTPSDLPLGRAIATTLANRAFRLYIVAQIFFVLGVTLIQPVLPYAATVLLGRSEGFGANIGLAMFLGILVGFALLRRFVSRLGAKRSMIVCVLIFALCASSLGLLRPETPGGPGDLRNLAVVFTAMAMAGLAVAGLLVLPHVLISQMIDADECATGANRAAMFFGMQGFFTKWVYGVALWIFTYLLARFGNSPGEPLGIILVGPVAAAAALVSAALFARYPERVVLAATRRELPTPE
jgi:GPH family glycoside/pentoside/hexuronide:cation symporter